MIHSIINKKSSVQRYADYVTYYKVAKTKGLIGRDALEYANAMTAGIFYS